MRLMFEKSAQFQQRHGEVSGDEIGPDRCRGDTDDGEYCDQCRDMQQPAARDDGVAHTPLAEQKHDRPDGRADDQASREGVVPCQEHLNNMREPMPRLRVKEIGFGIIVRIGQRCIIVMRQMRCLEPRIRNDQDQRRPDQRIVQACVSERMAMDNLMLQRSMKGDESRKYRDRECCWQHPQCGDPANVTHKDKAQRRPCDRAGVTSVILSHADILQRVTPFAYSDTSSQKPHFMIKNLYGDKNRQA